MLFISSSVFVSPLFLSPPNRSFFILVILLPYSFSLIFLSIFPLIFFLFTLYFFFFFINLQIFLILRFFFIIPCFLLVQVFYASIFFPFLFCLVEFSISFFFNIFLFSFLFRIIFFTFLYFFPRISRTEGGRLLVTWMDGHDGQDSQEEVLILIVL